MKGRSFARVKERSWDESLWEWWLLSQTSDRAGIQQVDIREVRVAFLVREIGRPKAQRQRTSDMFGACYMVSFKKSIDRT